MLMKGANVTGIDFLAFMAPDVEGAAAFFETHLGWQRTDGPPHAVVFDVKPIPVAVREPLFDLPEAPGAGIAPWILVDDTATRVQGMRAAGVKVLAEPQPGPFGLTATVEGPAGYALTLHDKA